MTSTPRSSRPAQIDALLLTGDPATSQFMRLDCALVGEDDHLDGDPDEASYVSIRAVLGGDFELFGASEAVDVFRTAEACDASYVNAGAIELMSTFGLHAEATTGLVLFVLRDVACRRRRGDDDVARPLDVARQWLDTKRAAGAGT